MKQVRNDCFCLITTRIVWRVIFVITTVLTWSVPTSFAFHIPASRHQQYLQQPQQLLSPWKSSTSSSYHVQQQQQQKKLSFSSSRTELSAAVSSSMISSPIGSFLVLAGIILVHETGHYLAARRFGITVEEFSIGFGPKVLGFEAFGNEFNLRALPLGGYVRFPENYNSTLVQEQTLALMNKRETSTLDETNTDTDKDTNNSLGFQIMNAVTLGAWSEQRRKKREREAAAAAAEAAAALQQQQQQKPWWKALLFFKKAKETETLSKQQQPKEQFEEDEIEIEYYDDPNLLQNRPWTERAVVLSGGIIFNLLLAFLIYFGEISSTGLPQPVFAPGAVITQNPMSSGPSVGLLQKGDIILQVNGKDISVSKSPTAAAAQRSISDFITTIRSTPEGESLRLSVLRPDSSMNKQQKLDLATAMMTNTRQDLIDVIVQPTRIVSTPGSPQSLGILLTPNFVQTDTIRSESMIEAIVPAAQYVYDMTTETAIGLLSFLSQLLSGQGQNSGQQISGPIGVLRTGSEVVATKDATSIFLFAAAISINLGVVNALPLPALDGGQLVFVLAEAVSGRKIDERFQEQITAITLFILVLASAQAAVGDVQSIFATK